MFPADYFIHIVQVQTPTETTFGPSSSAPVAVQCYVHEQQQVAETGTGTDSDERHTKITAAPGDADKFPLGARVTFDGQNSRVVSVSNRTHPINPDLNHVTVLLA